MDLTRPIEAVIPGAQGKLLGALVCAGEALTVSETARIADVSVAQASRVLPELAELGIVRVRSVGNAFTYETVVGNAVVELLEQLCNLREQVLDVMAERADEIDPRPIQITVYGSFARGESGSSSDIDVLVVRPASTDDERWVDSLERWRASVETFAGTPVSVLEVDEMEWKRVRNTKRSLWSSIREDGVVLLGAPDLQRQAV